MANSKFEYVKQFELVDQLLPGCWIVIRLDGKGFTKFCQRHQFSKPNDAAGLNLMDAAAKEVMLEFKDIRIAFGQSDEYSFVFHRSTQLYGRRSAKLISLVTSCFTGHYVNLWSRYLPETVMAYVPLFDARAVCYPTDATLRDYLAWRQADTHINNQYNTCYWALVKTGASPAEAQATLKGTLTDAKNEIMFKLGINYNMLPEQFRKGSVLIRRRTKVAVKTLEDGTCVERDKLDIAVLHVDIIKEPFWVEHPEILL